MNNEEEEAWRWKEGCGGIQEMVEAGTRNHVKEEWKRGYWVGGLCFFRNGRVSLVFCVRGKSSGPARACTQRDLTFARSI